MNISTIADTRIIIAIVFKVPPELTGKISEPAKLRINIIHVKYPLVLPVKNMKGFMVVLPSISIVYLFFRFTSPGGEKERQ